MHATIITVGDEILIGQIIDTNSAWIGEKLNLLGISIRKIISVGDDREDIKAALKDGFENSEIVLMTGGLGPTKDDITKQCIADFLHVDLEFSEPTWDRIRRFFERLERKTTEAHRQQCYMPKSAELLENKMGTAPGMWFEKNGVILISMPGVPYEMKYLMENEILPRLQKRFNAFSILHRTILTVGQGESRIAEMIRDFEDNLPAFVKLAYLPNLGRVRLRLSAQGNDKHELESVLLEKGNELKALLPEYVYGEEKDQLEEIVGKMLLERNLQLATAESCTGGYIAHQITSVPGSSAYFQGSVVSYANAVKQDMLGVKETTLIEHGAVSEATVKEMVQGVLKVIPADIGIAVSGIAGPGGGTPEKPVGTVWMAVGNKDKIETQKWQLGKDRLLNIKYTGTQALNMLRKFLLANYKD